MAKAKRCPEKGHTDCYNKCRKCGHCDWDGDGESSTPYRKPANKVRPIKGCPVNKNGHFYVHDRMVCHSGNSINTPVLWELNMRSFCLFCGKEKRGAKDSELDNIVHVRNWTPEEKIGRPNREWTYKVLLNKYNY